MTTVTRDCQSRTYDRANSAVFLKTREKYGGLSNMAGGFPLVVNGVQIRTSEALYQACRFPHLPELQREIISQKSPMTAKMKGKPYRHISRPDWDAVRVKIMRWCLQVKLAQNWDKFSEFLLETGDMPIVEHSRRDDFWGAKPIDSETLIGTNALGRLLMELRERLKCEPPEALQYVKPLAIPEFLLYDRPIEAIGRPVDDANTAQPTLMEPHPHRVREQQTQQLTIASSTREISETESAYRTVEDIGDLININTAEVSDLTKLPRIGSGLAQAIVDYREKRGDFPSTRSITSVRHIGEKTYQEIADKITTGHFLL
ncbi:MAG: NADAR domain-containing protein [Chloroflexota bacterium]|nr:NADAR domain-containing protein [Chloroflexota bacterium]MDE2959830.1 NADAR domain-containing protein [Chloroflexota bacterium]